MISLLPLFRRKKSLTKRIAYIGPMYIRIWTSVLKENILKEILFLLNSTARNLIWMRNFNTFSIILSLFSSSWSLTSSLLLTTKIWGSTFISICVTGTGLSEEAHWNNNNMHKYELSQHAQIQSKYLHFCSTWSKFGDQPRVND